MTASPLSWPSPADFAPPPTANDHARWTEADRAPVRPASSASRALRRRRSRCLFRRPPREQPLSDRVRPRRRRGEGRRPLRPVPGLGRRGRRPRRLPLRDPGSPRGARRGSRMPATTCPERGPPGGVRGARRVAVEAGFVPHACRPAGAAAPDVELVPVEGWVEADRAVNKPAELERVAAACAVADCALAGLLPRIAEGATERSLPWSWSGPCGPAARRRSRSSRHAWPGRRLRCPMEHRPALLERERGRVVRLRCTGRRLPQRHDPDAVRRRAFERIWPSTSWRGGAARGDRAADGDARGGGRGAVRSGPRRDREGGDRGDGRWPAYRHGLGHRIDLATHELPSLSRRATDAALPSPTVFSVEPGIYLEGETGVRIEDLFTLDAEAGRLDRLTQFPRDVLVVGR